MGNTLGADVRDFVGNIFEVGFFANFGQADEGAGKKNAWWESGSIRRPPGSTGPLGRMTGRGPSNKDSKQPRSSTQSYSECA